MKEGEKYLAIKVKEDLMEGQMIDVQSLKIGVTYGVSTYPLHFFFGSLLCFPFPFPFPSASASSSCSHRL